jgi:uncharacterized RDD family membrane protein YckC
VNNAKGNRNQLAGYGARIAAHLIDLILVSIAVLVVLFIMKPELFDYSIAQAPLPVRLIIFLSLRGVHFLYEALLLAWNGQTLGKKALKIRVIQTNGEKLDVLSAVIRSLVRHGLVFGQLLLGFPWLLGILNYIVIFFNKQRKCLHDVVAKTRVIKT